MSKNKETTAPSLNVAGLLALKRYERPEAIRAEKNIQNTMRAVRTTSNAPSLLLFPDKSFAWMFAQPRYGVAALFVIFLGLNLLGRPMPVASVSPVVVVKAPGADIMSSVDTNRHKAANVPGIVPAYTALAGEAAPLSSYVK
jgi:hypothetical protein